MPTIDLQIAALCERLRTARPHEMPLIRAKLDRLYRQRNGDLRPASPVSSWPFWWRSDVD